MTFHTQRGGRAWPRRMETWRGFGHNAVTVQPIKILYGTETDTALGLADELSEALKDAGIATQTLDMQEIAAADLADESIVVIVTSTYGNGDPPFNARALLEGLRRPDMPALNSTRYAVFGLGDSTYPKFCQCGRDFDARLEALGAQRFLPRVDADGDPCDLFAQWTGDVVGKLKSLV